MFRYIPVIPVIAVLAFMATGVIACSSSDDDDSSSPQPTTVSAQPTIAAAQPTTVAAQPTPQSTAGGSGGGSPSAPTTSAGKAVTIVDFGYSPTDISAKAGEAVTLNITNSGQAPHTFTIAGVTDSGTIPAGQSKTVTFTPTAAGSLQFFCSIHGATTMSGKVTVQ